MEEFVTEWDDLSNCTLISELLGFAGDGGEGLEDLWVGLSVLELSGSFGRLGEVFLD